MQHFWHLGKQERESCNDVMPALEPHILSALQIGSPASSPWSLSKVGLEISQGLAHADWAGGLGDRQDPAEPFQGDEET